MRHNKLDEMKLSTLLKALEKQPLKRLDLAYCHLDGMCGHPIAMLLTVNRNLQEIELKGNKLDKKGMAAIGHALESYEGVLVYLGNV
jgi:Ran GTPase-activating protein (RanGAP) involved in mRNA processing and transport